ncbi:MAG: HIT family protein [Alphaproteobacteria bacterium]|nr:HIT family protein [Alphaproteobacteria bacterium]
MTFILDHRLAESSFFIEDWSLCRISLKNDKTWPWLYLVPRRENIREIYDLAAPDQLQLIHEMAMAARALNLLYKPDKINTAALGNMVPQLHVHVFARFKDDPAWPKPVWAVQQDEISYTETEKNSELHKLQECFKKLRTEDKITCQR